MYMANNDNSLEPLYKSVGIGRPSFWGEAAKGFLGTVIPAFAGGLANTGGEGGFRAGVGAGIQKGFQDTMSRSAKEDEDLATRRFGVATNPLMRMSYEQAKDDVLRTGRPLEQALSERLDKNMQAKFISDTYGDGLVGWAKQSGMDINDFMNKQNEGNSYPNELRIQSALNSTISSIETQAQNKINSANSQVLRGAMTPEQFQQIVNDTTEWANSEKARASQQFSGVSFAPSAMPEYEPQEDPGVLKSFAQSIPIGRKLFPKSPLKRKVKQKVNLSNLPYLGEYVNAP